MENIKQNMIAPIEIRILSAAFNKKPGLKNCTKCNGAYSPYSVNEESDLFQYWCCIPVVDDCGRILPPSGLCGFCNPSSVWYINRN